MKAYKVILVLAFAVGTANAQDMGQAANGEILNVGLQKEIIQETPQATPQRVIIVNQQPAVAQAQVNSQPTTYVDAAPVAASKAELMRQRRQEAELKTEQKIVEKLEESRIIDENKRANRLFGNKLDPQPDQAVQQPPVVEPSAYPPAQQAVVVAPAPAPEQASTEEIVEAVREEVRADLNKLKKQNEPKQSNLFVKGELGLGEYLDCPCTNVDSQIATGVTVGWDMPSNFAVEGTFLYSNYYVSENYFAYKEMDQYNFGAAARYKMKLGRVTPNVGALLSYTYRKYTDPYSSGYYSSYNYNNDITSRAFDWGFVAGVDFEVAKHIAIGFDYKYITNLSNQSDLDNTYYYGYNNGYGNVDRLEDSAYQILSLSAKIKF